MIPRLEPADAASPTGPPGRITYLRRTVLTTALKTVLTTTLGGALVVTTAPVAGADPRPPSRPKPRSNRSLGYPSVAVYPADALFPVR